MVEVRLDAVPQKTQDFFNKGFAAFERGKLDYAIDMLSTCVELEPSLLQARRFLRAAELQRYRAEKTNQVSRALSLISSLLAYLTTLIAVKGKNALRGVSAADRLLRTNPLHKPYLFLFAHAAERAGIPEAAVQILEIARDNYPDDMAVLTELGRGFLAAGCTKQAIACFERICDLNPNDPRPIKELKDAMAVDTMASDGWNAAAEDGGSFRDMIKDSDEAVHLEQAGKAVKSEQDVEDLIADTLAKIESEPENVNYYRTLSRLYLQKQDFSRSIETLEKALVSAPGDPEVENALTDVHVQRFNAEIESLKAAGRDAEAAEKVVARDQLVFDSLQDRVARYPNDLNLRYKFGVMLFENDYFNEAIQQFQMAQRNPKHRPRALYYLGMCFRGKDQLDLAVEQLETAVSEMTRMDAVKKDICYALGELADLMGDRAKAAGYFKQIYQVDIQYKDISEKVEKGYTSHGGPDTA